MIYLSLWIFFFSVLTWDLEDVGLVCLEPCSLGLDTGGLVGLDTRLSGLDDRFSGLGARFLGLEDLL